VQPVNTPGHDASCPTLILHRQNVGARAVLITRGKTQARTKKLSNNQGK
jgi:hypothetical protein